MDNINQVSTENNQNEGDILQLMLNNIQMNNVQAQVTEVAIKELIRTKNEMHTIKKEVEVVGKNSKRSERVSIKVAELVLDRYEDMVKKDKLEDWEADEISELIGDKTTEITKKLFPTYDPIRKRGSTFLKEWVNVNKGLYSIYKKNVNGHKGSYRHTKRIKFSAAKEYIEKLTIIDYYCLREGDMQSIKKFVFVEPVFQERIDIEKMINDELDKEDNNLTD